MGHVPEYSAQCLIGHCGACPDPDCEHYCHPTLGPAPSTDFYEEDEPIDDLIRAFEQGEKGFTQSPS